MTAVLPVEVELRGPQWQSLPAAGDAIGTAIADLGASLGLDVEPEVDVRVTDATRRDGLPLGLRVASRQVRYGAVLRREVDRAVGDPPDADRRVAFAAMLCGHACALRAGVLFGPAQAAAYAARLRQDGTTVPDESWLREVLSGVLDLGIAVRDVPAVAEVLSARESDLVPAVREALISRLAAAQLRLLVPDEVATRLTAFDSGIGSDLSTAVVSQLSQETGVALPPLRTAAAAELPPGTFAFQVNDVATPPAPLPTEGTLLVNGSPDLVRIICPDADATATTMPGTLREACIVDAEHRADLDDAGYATWDHNGQLALVVAAHLRERMGWCVHQDRLQAQLDALGALAPRTVLAARTACPPWQLAVLVRKLATDHVPLTDLPGVLERLIEVPYLDLPEARLSLLGDPVTAVGAYPPSADRDQRLESFVRTGMRHAIAQTRLGGNDAVEVLLLDPATERRFRAGERAADDALLDSVAGWLGDRPGATNVPMLLVGDDVRARVADTLRLVYPVRVAAYGDLPSELLVITNARIPDILADENETP